MSVPKACLKRLQKEYMAIQKEPVENILCAPLPQNILEWHYCILGPKGTPYEGGYYHGKVKFPTEYPYKPPSIYMFTPNGRFHTTGKICLSMSDFHPETWNPMWSVSSILTGLLSFMLEEHNTYGSIHTSVAEKRLLAKKSLEANRKDKTFRQLFDPLIANLEKQARASSSNGTTEGYDAADDDDNKLLRDNRGLNRGNNNNNSTYFIFQLSIFILVVCLLVYISL